jgi:hypothetical protein
MFVGPVFGQEYWGGDLGATRFSTHAQITPADVATIMRRGGGIPHRIITSSRSVAALRTTGAG